MSARQDYTTYTEADAPGRIAATATVLTITSMDNDETCRLTYDFTADYFDSDFEHTLNFNTADVSTGDIYLWGLCNSAGQIGTLIAADTDLLCLMWDESEKKLVLTERNGAVSTSDTSSTLTADTDYYVRICRVESTGTYGHLYCYIYTDSQFLTPVDKLDITLTEAKDFRYLYAVSGVGNGGGGVLWTGTISDLKLDSYPYTLQNMRTRLRDLLNEDTAGFWTDAQLDRAINNAFYSTAERSLSIRHIDSLTTTTSTRTVSFSGYKVLYLEDADNGLGLPLTLPAGLGRIPTDVETPQRWFCDQSYIYIDPIPNGTYNIDAYIGDTPAGLLTSEPDIPEILPQFRPLIILKAFGDLLHKDKRVAQSSYILSIYETELAFLKASTLEFVPEGEDSTESYRSAYRAYQL